MKHIIITAVIATVTGVAGYFLGFNKGGHRVDAGALTEGEPKKVELFSSEAILQINPFGDSSVLSERSMILTKQLLETQFTMLKSKEILRMAIRDYKLDSLFGETEAALLERLPECVEIKQEVGTGLAVLIAMTDSEQEAQCITYAIIKSYEKRRREVYEKRREKSLAMFAKKRKQQESNVEKYRDELYSLSKKLGIPYHGRDQQYEKLLIDSSKTPEKLTLSAEQKTLFGRARDDYERELAILDAVKQAEFTETLGEGLERNPVILHQHGWGDEVEKLMESFE